MLNASNLERKRISLDFDFVNSNRGRWSISRWFQYSTFHFKRRTRHDMMPKAKLILFMASE